jgi:acetyl/propionyl-CoA carboxylase alpha subunit
MISKLVAWGETRIETIQRMKRALREYEILGVRTTIPVSLFVLEHPKFIEGVFDTHFLSNYLRPELLAHPSEEQLAAASMVCAMLHDRDGRSAAIIQFQRPPAISDKAIRKNNLSGNHLQRGTWKKQRVNHLR